jgi:hypothetical protein
MSFSELGVGPVVRITALAVMNFVHAVPNSHPGLDPGSSLLLLGSSKRSGIPAFAGMTREDGGALSVARVPQFLAC